MAKASKSHQLLESGDKIMVCMSGGKDSYVMLHLLRKVQKRVGFPFELIAVNLDQGHPGFPGHLLSDWLAAEGYAYKMIAQDTYSVVLDKVPVGKTYCSLCSRMRRGILYNAAVELGCTKIALGHHRDDMVETLMLNLLYSGQLKTMPPRLRSQDGRNTIIRPLAYCAEVDIAAYAEQVRFPIIPCDLCGSQDTLHRQKVKQLLSDLEHDNPKIKGNMMAAMANVQPSHLLDLDLRAAVGLDPITGVRSDADAAPRDRVNGQNQDQVGKSVSEVSA
jgi:tRNA 2-thiocytidine biosynthesis protein TtcA